MSLACLARSEVDGTAFRHLFHVQWCEAPSLHTHPAQKDAGWSRGSCHRKDAVTVLPIDSKSG